MAGRTEQARAQIIIDGHQAETLLQQLNTRSKELKEEMRKLKAEGKDWSGVQKELRQTESAMNSFKRATFNVSKVMQNLSKATMKDLSRASNQLKSDLKGMERGTQEYINKSKQLSVVRMELNKVQAEINGTAAAQQRANGSFGGGLKSMMAWAGGIYGLASFMGSSVSEYMEAEAAQKKVEQAVKQTGMAAGFTAKELDAMAKKYQETTIYDADEIMNKVTAQLLSFPKIAGENFKLAQTAALDLATLLGGDLQAASLQLGKALQDPVKGLTALRKSGVSFTEEQKEQIKVLQESGRLEEAQAIILSEVNRQYGGQAAAAAQGAGGINQLKNAWGDLKEDVGGFLVGEGKGVIAWLKGAIGWLRNNGDLILNIVKAIGSLIIGLTAYNAVMKASTKYKALFNKEGKDGVNILSLFNKNLKDASGNAMSFGQRLKGMGMGGWLGIISVALPLLISFKDELLGAVGGMNKMQAVTGEVNKRLAQETAELNVLKDQVLKTNISTEERSRLIGVINEKYGEYLPKLLTEKSTNEQIASALEDVNNQLERKVLLQMKDEMSSDTMKDKLETEMDRLELQKKLADVQARLLKNEYSTIGAKSSDITLRTNLSNKINDLIEKENDYQKELDETSALIDQMLEENKTKSQTGGGDDGPKEGDTMEQGGVWYVYKSGKWVLMKGGGDGSKPVGAYQELSNKISEVTEKLRNFITEGKTADAQQQQILLNQLNAQKAFVDNIAKYGGDVKAYLKSISDVDTETIDDLETQMDEYLLNNREGADEYAKLEKERKDAALNEEMGRLEAITQKQIEEADKQKKIDEELQLSKKKAAEDFYNFLVDSGKQFLIDKYSAEKDEEIQIAEESYNKEVEGYKQLLDDKKISEDEYNAKVKAATDKLNEEKKKAERDKALWSIAVDTAIAVAKSIAKSPETFGLPFSAYATAQGLVQAGIVMAQKARGQYPVVGADDGKTYNADYRGAVRRTHIASTPGIYRGVNGDYLAGETNLPELIVSGPHFRNLQMNYPEVLRAIYATRMTQHAAGNYPAVSASASDGNSAAMLAVLTELLMESRKPKRSYVVKSDIDDIQSNEDFISDNFTG